MKGRHVNGFPKSPRWVLVGVASLSIAACQRADPANAGSVVVSESPAPPAATASAKIRPVASNLVCMVNNRFMGTEQIRVAVGDKTYFGCCEMCEGRLKSNPAVRTATDPVTGRPVDKASAIIGALPNGEVRYFESEASFARFAAM